MKSETHKLAMKITALLIESELSIKDQLQVINNVRERLIFCKKTGKKMKQLTLL